MHGPVIVRWNLDSVPTYMGRASLLLRQYSIMAQYGRKRPQRAFGLLVGSTPWLRVDYCGRCKWSCHLN